MNEAINFTDCNHLFFIGLFLVGLWSSAFLISGGYAAARDWLDDYESNTPSPLNVFIAGLFGWRRTDSSDAWAYRRGPAEKYARTFLRRMDDTPCVTYWAVVSVFLLLAPLLIFKIPTITAVAVSSVATLFGARYLKRLVKKFTKHVEDKDIHTTK